MKMSPDRKTSIFLMTTSTATVLMITAMCLARSVDAMATNRPTGSTGEPENVTYADNRMGPEPQIEGLLINECCSNGKILNDSYECEDVKKKDRLDVIANSIAVDDLLKAAIVNSNVMVSSSQYRYICSGDQLEVVFWPKDGQPKTHYINHTSGELLLVQNETIVKTFAPITYCVDEAIHGGQLMYALMTCPCTVTTCIQKCCPEGEYFDTETNACAPLKEDISGFQPQLHHMKNESSKHTPFYLTEGNPACGNSLEKLQLNVTHAYPQESGWLMVDDTETGRYMFYERSKYCLDTFSDSSTNDSTLGGFVCNEDASNYTYEEAASREEMEEWLPATVRASRKMHHYKDLMMNVELNELKNVTEIMNVEMKKEKEMMNIEARADEDARAEDDKMPEINIKSFDSKAGAGKIGVVWEMIATCLVMLLFKQ